MRNQGEEGIDCGVPCPTPCSPATCDDGVRNQGEEAVDCGGPCPVPCPPTCTVQVRRLISPPIFYHEDICVDDTCYSAGPIAGTHRRDLESSLWALTDADGWSTTPGWSFDVTPAVCQVFKYYMDSEVTETVTKSTFLQNLWQYYSNGFCITFSRTHFHEMAWMAGFL